MARLFALVIILFTAGCTSFGPAKVTHDRFNYGNAIGASAKEQLLMNVVRLRYMDAITMLTVVSVITSYSLEGTVSVTGEVEFGTTNILTSGVSGAYTQSPTITYNELTGKEFVERIMIPAAPSTLVALVESSWRADRIFSRMVEEINGIRNRNRALEYVGDPRFPRVAALFLALQRDGAVAFVVSNPNTTTETLTLKLVNPLSDPAVEETFSELRAILGLDQTKNEFAMVFGRTAPDDQTIAIKTRSTMQIMLEFSTYIEIPADHLTRGHVESYREFNAQEGHPPVVIQSGKSKPDDTYTAVKYLDSWFWIDNGDFETKRSFAVLLLMFAIAESGEDAAAPVLTVSTN